MSDSGRVLSLEEPGHGTLSDARPGPEHDERRLRVVHMGSSAVVAYLSAVRLY